MPDSKMIIARAPVRISFGGGGTDLPSYYEQFEGMVISTTINHYIYVFLKNRPGEALQIISSDYNTFFRQPLDEDLIWDGNLSLPRAVVHHFGIKEGLELFLASQIPPGTGLGSSGSVAVALIQGLSHWLKRPLDKAAISELGCYIEIDKMNMPVGKQDQYAAAYGGLNQIIFSKDKVTVNPLNVTIETRKALEKRLLLFFTGSTRKSSTILRFQKKGNESKSPEVIDRMHAIKALGMQIKDALEAGNLDAFGNLLHQSWEQKRKISPHISNVSINTAYETARILGALGGKITGAGGGGFLMLYCPEETQKNITKALQQQGLNRLDFAFDSQGVQVMEAAEINWNAPVHTEQPLQAALV